MSTTDEAWLLIEKYQNIKSAAYDADCERLRNGEPLAYIIGHIPFLHTIISLDSHPLIPRTETEYWVEYVIKRIHAHKTTSSLQILDLCAGSGCIGVAIGNALPDTAIDFIELDEAHIPTIQKNCQHNHLASERVRIIASDLFAAISPQNQYHHIVSNPPYIDTELDRTDESVKKYEPALALYGGTFGLALIAPIILKAPHYLQPNGTLWLEHEPEQVLPIAELAAGLFSVTTHNDQYGVPRFSELVLQ
jgi:release factor glutamine methyltransferase